MVRLCDWLPSACEVTLDSPELVLRVLYRIRSLSEQGAFDAAAFSYIAAFFTCIVEDHTSMGSEDEDEPLERIALILAILNFHTNECESPALLVVPEFSARRTVSDRKYPRSRTISDLLHIIKKFPSLGKDASSVLVGIGEAVNVDSTLGEIRILVASTLASEAYVRNSALQCLQVLSVSAALFRKLMAFVSDT